MKFIILIGLSFFNLTAFSQVKVINDKNGNIQLTATSCEILVKNFKAIKEWKLKKGEVSDDKGACSCSDNKCSIMITNIIPDDLKDLEGQCSSTYGPNCFNTALVDQGMIKHRRIVSTEELKFWINSDLCKERKEDEQLRPGDLLVISHGEELPLHGFIYISDDLVYSKGGPDNKAKYELTSYDSMFTNYSIPIECRRKFGHQDPSVCKKYANAYKCESFEQTGLKSNNDELNSILNELDRLGCEVDKKIFPEAMGFTVGKEILISSIEILRIKILDNRDDPKLSVEDKFLWDMAYYRFMSLRRQIDFFK